jgi:hypothetical protein
VYECVCVCVCVCAYKWFVQQLQAEGDCLNMRVYIGAVYAYVCTCKWCVRLPEYVGVYIRSGVYVCMYVYVYVRVSGVYDRCKQRAIA